MKRVLVFAPHNDDEVLGVGGTIAVYVQNGYELTVCEVTAGDLEDEMVQLQKREAKAAHAVLGVSSTIFMDLPVVALRELSTVEKNAAFSKVVDEVKPEIVFIPHYGDIHVDHQEVTQAAMVALRPHAASSVREIYAYETLSETEWNIPSAANAFIPNVWIDISSAIDTKIEAMRCHASQIRPSPHPRSLEAIRALAQFRGATVCVPYAEAFMLIRKIERT